MALADTAKLIASLELKDSFSRGLKTADKNLSAFEKRFGKVGATAQKGIGNAASNLAKGAAIVGAATVGLVTASVKAAADYEQAFAGVAKTVDATDAELAKLSATILDLSTTIPISAVELAALGEAAGALGVAKGDINEFIRITALLGETTDLSAQQAADSIGVLTNVLGLTGDQISRFGAALVDLGNNGASTESQIVQIAQRFGAAGKLAGLSTQDILGFSSAVASLGIEVEAGGSSLQKFAIDTTKMVAAGGKDLALLAKTAGVTGKAYQDAFEKDAGGALASFLTGLGKLQQAEQLAVLEALGFNDVRITRALLGLANNSELLNEQLAVSARGWEENTALTTEADKKFKTLSSQLTILRNSFTRAGIAVGTGLLNPLADVAKILSTSLTDPAVITKLERLGESLGEALKAFVKQIGPNIPRIVGSIADGFADIATYISKIDLAGVLDAVPWDTIKTSMEVTGRVAKVILDTFLSMPSWVQTAVVTGWGLNKLTGGALGSIAGQLTGAVTKGLLGGGRGSTPLNPLFVKDVGLPGGKGGGIPGAPVGGAGAAAGGLLAAGPLAAAVAVAVPLVMLLAIPLLTKGKEGQGGPAPGGANARFDGEAFNLQFTKSLSPALAAAAYGPEAQKSDELTRARIDAVSAAVNTSTGFVTGEQQATTAAVNASTGFVTGSLTQMDAAIVESAQAAEAGRRASEGTTAAVNEQTGFVTGKLSEVDAAIVAASKAREAGERTIASAINEQTGFVTVKGAVDSVTSQVSAQTGFVTGKLAAVDASIVAASAARSAGEKAQAERLDGITAAVSDSTGFVTGALSGVDAAIVASNRARSAAEAAAASKATAVQRTLQRVGELTDAAGRLGKSATDRVYDAVERNRATLERKKFDPKISVSTKNVTSISIRGLAASSRTYWVVHKNQAV